MELKNYKDVQIRSYHTVSGNSEWGLGSLVSVKNDIPYIFNYCMLTSFVTEYLFVSDM